MHSGAANIWSVIRDYFAAPQMLTNLIASVLFFISVCEAGWCYAIAFHQASRQEIKWGGVFCKKKWTPLRWGCFFVKRGPFPTKWNETESNFAFYFTFYLFWGVHPTHPTAHGPDFMDYVRCHFFILSGIVPTPRSIWTELKKISLTHSAINLS